MVKLKLLPSRGLAWMTWPMGRRHLGKGVPGTPQGRALGCSGSSSPDARPQVLFHRNRMILS